MPTVTASVVAALSGGSRALSYFLGAVVLALALAMGAPEPGEILDWAARVLGGVFIGLLSCLILATLYCWQRLLDRGLTSGQRQAWHEAGLHAANGIATLALATARQARSEPAITWTAAAFWCAISRSMAAPSPARLIWAEPAVGPDHVVAAAGIYCHGLAPGGLGGAGQAGIL